MKAFQHQPIWKRLIAILMIVLMLMPSSGYSALAEEPEANEESTLMAEGPEGPSETVLNMIAEAEEKLLQSLEAEGEPATPEDEDGTDGTPESESTGDVPSDLPPDQIGANTENEPSDPQGGQSVEDTENVTPGLQEDLNSEETEEAPENPFTEETPEGEEPLLTPVTALDESQQPKGTDGDTQKVRVVFRALFEAEETETEIEATTEAETATDAGIETGAATAAEPKTDTQIPFRVSVYPVATEEIPEPEAIPAEEDGSFLLLPGNYVYTAEAEGYAPIDRTDFTVTLPENGEAQTVELCFEAPKLMLFAAPALKAAPPAAAGKYRIVIHPKKATLADFYSIRIVIEDKDENPLATQEPALNQENKWSDIEVYFNLTTAPAIITISSMYAVAPSGGGGDYSTDPTAPHGGSYEYEQLSYTAAFHEGTNQFATADSTLFPRDGKINFCDYSIQYLSENGQLPYRDKKGQIQYVEEGKWQNFIGSLDQSGWYAVREDYASPALAVSGDVNLVLCDGVTMNIAETGISIPKGSSLTIWGQEANSGTLIANGSKRSDVPSAGIEVITGASLTINGGVITATGGANCAGIGSNGRETNEGDASTRFPDSGTITINGGTVTATGGKYGAGIGSGNCSNSGSITISGGTVTATAGAGGAGIGGGQQGDSAAIVISGGTIVANGNEGGAGIGGGDGNAGHSTRSNYGNSGSITISGGTVTASASMGGAGIGGGYWQTNKGKIEITGGTVIANCEADKSEESSGAGIGAGRGCSQEGDIIISGGTVMGVSNAGGAGIGGGSGINGNKGLSGGVIHISGKDTDVIGISARGAGIGSGGTLAGQNFDAGGYNGGTITIDEGFVYGRSYQGGAGIGGGLGGDAGKITINGGYVMGIGGKRDYNWAKEDMKDDPFSGPGKHPVNRWMDQDAFELISRAALSIAFSDTYIGAGIGSGSNGSDDGFGNFIHINGGYVEAKAGSAESCSIGWGYHASGAIKVEVYTDAFVTYGHFEKKYETDKDYELVIDSETNRIKYANEAIKDGFALIEPGHTVSYNMLGHGTAPQSTKIAYGNKLNEPAKPSAEGWTFLGWFLDEACSQKVTFPLEIGEDTTLYAGWKQDSTPLKELKVQLFWGEGESKPEAVTVVLERQQENENWASVGTSILNAGNGWTGSFTEPEAGSTYRIREMDGNSHEVLDGTEETGSAPSQHTLRNQAVFTVREDTADREYQYSVTYGYTEAENLTTITHSRSGIVYSAKVDWKVNESSYTGDYSLPAVTAVLQHYEADGSGQQSWKTVESAEVLILSSADHWIGKFKPVAIDSDESKYRVRLQVSNRKDTQNYDSGFVFDGDDSVEATKILYDADDTDGDRSQPFLRYKWRVRHADSTTPESIDERIGVFHVAYGRDSVITIQEAYTVTTASSLVNGTIAVDKTMAAAGETVTVTVTPKDGCKLVALSYTPDGGTEQTVTEQNGKYSFTMPAANVFVSAIFSGTPYYYTADQVKSMISGTSGQLPHPRETWEEDRNSTLFLGWYEDSAYTEPISNASDVPVTGAYARFIPENSLGLGVQFRTPAKSGNPDKTDLRLVAVIPDLKLYRQIGFKVEMLYKGSYVTLTDESYGTEIYSDYIWQTVGSSRSKFTVQNALATGIGNETWSKNLTCYALMDMPNTYYVKDGQPVQTNFRVTQYLVTKDGSRSEVGAKKFYITYENGQPVAKPAS